MRALVRLLQEVIDLIYPPACALCTHTEVAADCRFLCLACLEVLQQARIPDLRLSASPATAADPARAYVADLAAWSYEGPLAVLVPRMKYHGRPSFARILGELAAVRLQPQAEALLASPIIAGPPAADPPVLVPVPLHVRRQRERGFNQSLLLARTLARQWGWPVCARALRRTRYTPPQASLRAHERQGNVQDAFAPDHAVGVAGRRVFLVDDVITTGATLDACARILRQSGAALVFAVALARAQRDQQADLSAGAPGAMAWVW